MHIIFLFLAIFFLIASLVLLAIEDHKTKKAISVDQPVRGIIDEITVKKGRPAIFVRITDEIRDAINAKLRELSIDPIEGNRITALPSLYGLQQAFPVGATCDMYLRFIPRLARPGHGTMHRITAPIL